MSLMPRPYAIAGIALVSAGLIVPDSAVTSSSNVQEHGVQLTAGGDNDDLVGLIIGGSGIPIPANHDDYVQDADDLYIQRILPGADSHGVFTPEGLSPIYTGVKSLPLDTSVDQGRQMLDSYITDEVADSNTVAVYGESQSSTIAGFVMDDLEEQGIDADAVKFVLVGDPSNPAGGLLERFDGLTLPSLGITFSGATPPDTIYDTAIYTQEYDGFADFPKYPINFLADLNAFLGIQSVHPTYRDLSEEQLDNAIKLDTSADYDGNTDYYMIPHDNLPLLEPLRALPVVGDPMADLLQPALTEIVNLGYDNPDNEGWDAGPANEPSEFGLFPSWEQIETALNNLGPAIEQGFNDAWADITSGDLLSDFDDPASVTAELFSADSLPSFTEVINGFSGALADAYSILLPTTDIVNALVTSLPAYNLSLFAENIFTDPLDAIGLPLAADTGLLTLAAGIEYMTISQTIESISEDLSGLF